MSVQVYIPTPFRRATKNADRVAIDAPDVKGLLDELEDQFGGLKGLVRNEQGEVHHHVNIYVNNEAIEALQGLETTLRDGDEVSIIPALAGGGPALAGGGPALAGGGPALAGGGPALAGGGPALAAGGLARAGGRG
jgi:sulfur-carrier protein